MIGEEQRGGESGGSEVDAGGMWRTEAEGKSGAGATRYGPGGPACKSQGREGKTKIL